MIPKIIHQMAPKSQKLWHPIWKHCHPTWKKHFPEGEYEHFMWTDDKIMDFDEEYPEYLFLYHAFPYTIMKIDFARALVLHKYGGIYADMDYFCTKNFYEDLNKNLIFVESPSPLETLQNSLMCSKKGHKFWIKYCELIDYRYQKIVAIPAPYIKEWSDYVHYVTGPKCLEKSLKVYNRKNKDKVQTLDKNFYNPPQFNINEETCKQIKCFHALSGLWGRSIYDGSTSSNEEMEKCLMNLHKVWRDVDFSNVISHFK
jgi:mannosyltransferase OCH1-like enzyme